MLTLTLPLLLSLSAAQGPAWDQRAVEHLLNRAGFGGNSAQVDRWVKAGQEALVDHLLKPRKRVAPWNLEAMVPYRERFMDMEEKERKELAKELRRELEREANTYLGAWIKRMVAGNDPLGDRMGLFWHGLFTSSLQNVRRGDLMIRQHELLRTNSLGNYGQLLREMVLDPAMLVYLDNTSNRRGRPNENLARELMELFSLGEGNYTEVDVKEAARALTGYGVERGGGHQFKRQAHDFGKKTILGREGRFDADELVNIILRQEACPRWIAGRLLKYFEGVEPSEERLAQYAKLLKSNTYELRPVLRALFMDPKFYRPEVVGSRVLSPIDYMVGSCRRLGVNPDPGYIYFTSGILGEKLFYPPNVKGWEGGMTWITTATLMQRSNLIGVMLGLININDLKNDEEVDEMMAMNDSMQDSMEDSADSSKGRAKGPRQSAELVKAMRALHKKGGRRSFTPPATRLRRTLARAHADSDLEVVQGALRELLAIDPPSDTAAALVEFLKVERQTLDLSQEDFLIKGGQDAERILRRLAHKILSLPEAQLG